MPDTSIGFSDIITKDQLEAIADRVRYTDAAFETFYALKYGDPKWNESFNIGGGFWAIIRKALFENSLLYIYEIRETLRKLLNGPFMKEDGYEELCNLNSKLNGPIFEKLRNIRIKSLAHFDLETLNDDYIEELFTQNQLEIEGIREAIKLEADLCSALAGYNISVRYINFDDVTRVLNFIYRHQNKDRIL
jgi:hypothetical protein